MTIDDLIKEDSNFSESGFIAKVDNTFIMLLTAIMTDNIKRVEHKISSDLFNKYKGVLDELNKNNERQMYDELNVKSTSIQSIEKENNKYVIKVLLTSRYMDYVVDKKTGDYKRGINNQRVEKDNYLTFEKIINAKDEGVVKTCPGCGANVDFNSSGVCNYCGATFDTQNYDWILTDIS